MTDKNLYPDYENATPAIDTPVGSDADPAVAAPAPQLQEDLPQLGGGMSQGANKKALLFLVLLGVLGLGFAFIAIKSVFKDDPKPEKAPKETQLNVSPVPDFSPDAAQQEQERLQRERERLQAQGDQAAQALALLPKSGDLPALPGASKEPAPVAEPLPLPVSDSVSVGDSGRRTPLVGGARPSQDSGLYNFDNEILGGSAVDTPKKNPVIERRGAGGSIINTADSSGGGSDASANSNSSNGEVLDGGAKSADDLGAVKASVRKLRNPNYTMVRGTYIRCVLETRIVSDVSGFTTCIVTDPVYSFSGKKRLIEKGSRISGQYLNGNLDSGRVAIIWNRILTPSGKDIQLNSPGIDRMGGSAHPGYVDEHWVQRMGGAIFLSLVADVINYTALKTLPTQKKVTVDTSTGSTTTIEEPFNSKTVDRLTKLPDQILAKTLNKPTTVYINQGELISIYTAKDIDFSSVMD